MVRKTGTTGADSIDGTTFDDVLVGLDGDDTLVAIFGDDSVRGGAGNDQIFGDWGNDTLLGGTGDDTFYAGGDNDLLYGGEGNDLIVANDINFAGSGQAWGGAGDDTIVLYSTEGGDLFAGAGIDTVNFVSIDAAGIFVDLDNSQLNGNGSFVGGVRFTGFERLTILTYQGDDTILGGDLADRIEVNQGANDVQAKDGDDFVGYMTTDTNRLDGGVGDDTLAVGDGGSSLYFIVDPSDGSVDDGQLSLLTGFEHYWTYGGDFDDIVSLGTGADLFWGGDGADTGFGGGGDDDLIGGRGDDQLQGDDGNDKLLGRGDSDQLFGGNGNDTLAGGLGDDSVDAGAGDDSILLYLGFDTVTGGDGADMFLFNRNQNGSNTIADFVSGVDGLGISSQLLPFGPSQGPLDPALLSFGAATGSSAQFVLVYNAINDQTTLLWDDNGANPSGGAYLMCHFTGNISLSAQDILII